MKQGKDEYYAEVALYEKITEAEKIRAKAAGWTGQRKEVLPDEYVNEADSDEADFEGDIAMEDDEKGQEKDEKGSDDGSVDSITLWEKERLEKMKEAELKGWI